MTRIYFVRHGESEYNKLKRYAGTIDSPLTGLGKEQAKETGALLKNKNITHILSSSLSRASDTAIEIKNIIDVENDIPLELTSLLQEVNFGDIQDKAYDDTKSLTHGITSGTGDSAETLIERAQKFLKLLEQTETSGNILVVGHGVFSSVIFAIKEGRSENNLIEYINQWPFHNGQIKELL